MQVDAEDNQRGKKKLRLLNPMVKSFDLISRLQDIWGLKNRHEAWEKLRRTRGPEGLEVCEEKRSGLGETGSEGEKREALVSRRVSESGQSSDRGLGVGSKQLDPKRLEGSK